MTGIDGTVAELAGLWPFLAAALARDAGGDGGGPGAARVSMTVVNADVLAAMLALDAGIPAAVRRACEITGEPWRARDLAGHLRQVPRLAGRMHAIGRLDGERELTAEAAGWLRMTKRALGLRRPDIPLPGGLECPWAEARPESHPGSAVLLAAGAEGFLRPDGAGGLRVEWVTSGLIYCPSDACAASWPPSQWPLLGRLLETADAP